LLQVLQYFRETRIEGVDDLTLAEVSHA